MPLSFEPGTLLGANSSPDSGVSDVMPSIFVNGSLCADAFAVCGDDGKEVSKATASERVYKLDLNALYRDSMDEDARRTAAEVDEKEKDEVEDTEAERRFLGCHVPAPSTEVSIDGRRRCFAEDAVIAEPREDMREARIAESE